MCKKWVFLISIAQVVQRLYFQSRKWQPSMSPSWVWHATYSLADRFAPSRHQWLSFFFWGTVFNRTTLFLVIGASMGLNFWPSRSSANEFYCSWPRSCMVILHSTEVSSIITWVCSLLIVRRAGLLWSQQDFEWRWSVPIFKCLTVLEFSFNLFDLCLLITFFNFIMNYVHIVTFWIFTYHKIWILSIMFCFIWSYWIIHFLACLEVSWRVAS